MDEIYEWLNPRVSIEYILLSFLVLCVAIVVVMLMTKGKKMMRLVLGALLSEYYFLVVCSTVICRPCHHGKRIELMPFWNYPDIWYRVDYPADLIEVLLNIALFIPIGLLLGGLGMKFKKAILIGIVLSVIIELSQLVYVKGLCETNDVIHNTIGCVVGYLCFCVLLKIHQACVAWR